LLRLHLLEHGFELPLLIVVGGRLRAGGTGEKHDAGED
jgi:hypothetical protein